jgi:uncharacterized protein
MTDGKEVEVHKMLLAVVRSLVDQPEEVEIAVCPEKQVTVFRIQTNPSDTEKLIGPEGRTAHAIRTIVGVNGLRLKRNFSIDIIEVRPGNLPISSSDSQVVQASVFS